MDKHHYYDTGHLLPFLMSIEQLCADFFNLSTRSVQIMTAWVMVQVLYFGKHRTAKFLGHSLDEFRLRLGNMKPCNGLVKNGQQDTARLDETNLSQKEEFHETIT